MLKKTELLVIFSRTGRALAESAQRAGLSSVVIDAYADVDTRVATRCCKALVWNDEGPVDAKYALQEYEDASGLVYGGGLEAMPDPLEPWYLAHKLYGNGIENIRNINNPWYFFKILDEIDIPSPKLRFDPPPAQSGWLIKRAGTTGGGHVRHWTGSEAIGSRDYFQERLSGPVMSVLFLANGERAFIVGWNTQWTRPGDFVWGGAINRALLNQEQQMALFTHVQSLVSILQLRGLNSLDFVLDDGEAKIIELNPRPGATLELYDEDFRHGLLYWHLQACCGRLPEATDISSTKVRGSRIVFARTTMTIQTSEDWPAWCHDLPADGVVINRGEPVCSVMASGADSLSVVARLQRRVTEMEQRLTAFQQVA